MAVGGVGSNAVRDRMKVDLTKYIEKHQFVFDEVFDAESNNEEVRNNKRPF